MTEIAAAIMNRLPISIGHPSNRFWAATSISTFGWVLTIRIRRKGERQTYRRWVTIDVFNYNYSDEAKAINREKNEVLGRNAFPADGQEQCHSCGQTIPHGHGDAIRTDGGSDHVFEVEFRCENCGGVWRESFPAKTHVGPKARGMFLDRSIVAGPPHSESRSIRCPTCELIEYVQVNDRTPLEARDD